MQYDSAISFKPVFKIGIILFNRFKYDNCAMIFILNLKSKVAFVTADIIDNAVFMQWIGY